MNDIERIIEKIESISFTLRQHEIDLANLWRDVVEDRNRMKQVEQTISDLQKRLEEQS